MSEARLQYLEETPIVAVVRDLKEAHAPYVIDAAIETDLRTFEFTIDTPEVEAMITEAVEAVGVEAHIGCGTIKTLQELRRAHQAGAHFFVSPENPVGIWQYCRVRDLPFMPGAHSPQEISNAIATDPYMVKVFPASTGGPGHIRQIRSPYSEEDVRLMVSGGVRLNNIGDFFEAGASAVSIGGGIINQFLEMEDWIGLKSKFKVAVRKVRQAREELEAETLEV